MSIKSKMTAIADKMRDLLGITDKMGLDEMATNLDVCQSVVDTQAELLEQALSAIENKTSGETVVVTPVLQSKVVTPSEDEKVVVPDVGYDALSSVSVGAIDRSYVGSEVERMDESVITPGVDSQTIPSGIYLDGSQTILGDKDLIPENIKQGVDIFGVKGIYAGEDAGVDMSDGDALETDIANGKVAYTKEGRVVGSLEVVESGFGYGFPACYYGIYGDGSKFSVDAIVSDKKIWDEGSFFTAEIESSDLGDAAAEDVVAGKTFTSKNGVKIPGTYVPSSDLPSGITKIASGTFKLSEHSTFYTISHNLNLVPNFLIVTAVGDIDCSEFIDHVMCYSVFASKLLSYIGSSTYTSETIEFGISVYANENDAYETTFSQECHDLSDRFTNQAAYIQFEDWTEVSLKSGTTYRWICGLIDI